MSRIAQVANFVSPHSGGIRTVLGHLAAGYAAAGHEVLQIVPGATFRQTTHGWGELIELPGHVLPGTGYRLITSGSASGVLSAFRPDRLEVHDRATLRGLGGWARQHDVPSCVVSHERLDRLVEHWTRRRVRTQRFTDASNRRLSAAFDTVVCTTPWAAEEFERLRVANLQVVPLGVDHDRFTLGLADQTVRRQYASDDETLLAMAIRLSPEKRPDVGIDTLRYLVGRGRAVRLVVAGDGPLRTRLERSAASLPIEFIGHLDPDELAALLANADVVLAPGPVETFGLAALESLACGTPVVVSKRSALPGVVGDAGRAAESCGICFADAVEALLAQPTEQIRVAAHARAVAFDWSRTVDGFLAVHGLQSVRAAAA
jgi:alpha-1,6-mannosyltransferase